MDRLEFPAGFLWGVATSAHQVEGENTANQWWDWEQQGKLHTPDSSVRSLEWWQGRWAEDFDRARALGLNAFRLSVEWSRLEPAPGAWDEAAVARYRQLLEGLRARGLEPMVTLHHFTSPRWFEGEGGWTGPRAAEHFERFARRAVEAFGDLCQLWCTINEPGIVVVTGYVVGQFPPGRTGDLGGALHASAALIRAHARAYRAVKAVQPHGKVGWAHHVNSFDPATGAWLDRAVTRLRHEALNNLMPRVVIDGALPRALRPVVGDLSEAHDTFDFVGINTYYRDVVRFDAGNARELFGSHVPPPPSAPRSDQPPAGIAWGEVYPQGIERVARELAARTSKPLYVTESGVADRADRLRPWVVAAGVRSCWNARAAGIDLRGYFHWTLVDNFEWAEGFSCRFGLFELDQRSQERRPRPSAELYGAIARANGLDRELARRFGPKVEAELD